MLDQRLEVTQWEQADQAYLIHHFACGPCSAAGRDPRQQRCATGAALWISYEEAGMPAHVTGAIDG